MRVSADPTKSKPLFDKKRVYSIPEAAEILRLHPNTLYKMCRSGELPAYKAHTTAPWRIPGSSLDTLRTPAPGHKTGPKPKQKEGAE